MSRALAHSYAEEVADLRRQEPYRATWRDTLPSLVLHVGIAYLLVILVTAACGTLLTLP